MAQHVAAAVRVPVQRHGVRVVGRDHDERVVPGRHAHRPVDGPGQRGRLVHGQPGMVEMVSDVDEAALDEQVVAPVAAGKHAHRRLRHVGQRRFRPAVGQQLEVHVAGREQTCGHARRAHNGKPPAYTFPGFGVPRGSEFRGSEFGTGSGGEGLELSCQRVHPTGVRRKTVRRDDISGGRRVQTGKE